MKFLNHVLLLFLLEPITLTAKKQQEKAYMDEAFRESKNKYFATPIPSLSSQDVLLCLVQKGKTVK